MLSPLASETSLKSKKNKSKKHNKNHKSDANSVLNLLNKKFETVQKIMKKGSKYFDSQTKISKN